MEDQGGGGGEEGGGGGGGEEEGGGGEVSHEHPQIRGFHTIQLLPGLFHRIPKQKILPIKQPPETSKQTTTVMYMYTIYMYCLYVACTVHVRCTLHVCHIQLHIPKGLLCFPLVTRLWKQTG